MSKKPNDLSVYARCFDETNPEWTKSPDFNVAFISTVEHYMNHKLRANGFVFLNEVYEALGFARTSAGQLVGWLINSHEGDGYIDFGIKRERVFYAGRESYIWLDFNVDGVIYEKIDQLTQGAHVGEEVTEKNETTVVETKAPEPSTPAQNVVDEVHEKVEETAPVVEETTTTTTTTEKSEED